MIKVSGLIQKMVNKSDPSLALFMIQKIYCMYHDIKNKEARNYAMVLTSMADDIQAQKNDRVEDFLYKAENNQPLLQIINIPYDINEIQPRSTQV